MKPGRELDQLIGDLILKYKNIHWSDCVIEQDGTESIGGMYRGAFVFQPVDNIESYLVELPYFSTEISEAWKILDFFIESKILVNLTKKSGSKFWVVEIGEFKKKGISAPLTICLAALENYISIIEIKRLLKLERRIINK